MDSRKNRQINLMERGQLLLYDHPGFGLQIHEFIKVDQYVRNKPYCFYVRHLLGQGMNNEIRLYRYELQSDRVKFIDKDSKEYKSLMVLYGQKE